MIGTSAFPRATTVVSLVSILLTSFAPSSALSQEQDARSILTGQWHGSNAGDDDVEFTARFEPGRVVVTGFRGLGRQHRREIQLTYGDRHVTGSDSEGHQFHFLVEGPNRLTLWISGDDYVAELRRAGHLPAVLLGEWQVTEPRRCEDSGRVLDIQRGTIRLREGQRELERPMLVATGVGDDIILAFSESDEDFPELHEVHRVSDDVWLLRRIDDDDFTILHRAGRRPAWAGCGAESVDLENPCGTAHERVSACVEEACTADPGNPLCLERALVEQRFSEADCTADMESFARDLARSSCQQIIEALTLGR